MHARAAADKVKFDLELLPEYMNAPDAMAPDAIEIHPGTPNTYFEQKEVKGQETAPFFADANNVVAEGSYYTQRQPHLPIEPDVGYGYMNEEGKLVIHSKSIGLHLHGLMIAPGLGLDFGNDMVMVQCNAGRYLRLQVQPDHGSAHRRGRARHRPSLPPALQLRTAAAIHRQAFAVLHDRPLRRRQGHRQDQAMEVRLDRRPRPVLGIRRPADPARCPVHRCWLRHSENIRGLGRTVCTNHAWGAAFRGYGGPESEFASEVLMDELAEKLGMDPLELRASQRATAKAAPILPVRRPTSSACPT